MQKKLIVANWKMNPVKSLEAKKIFSGIQKNARKVTGAKVVICPPFVFLPELAKLMRGKSVELGAQDLFYEESGAYTGQISPEMARVYNAKWAIIGHSERRELGESDHVIERKVSHVVQKGYNVILCVGEKLRSEDGAYYVFVRNQLDSALAGVGRKHLKKIVIAYEPIWAIGKRAEEAMQQRELMEMSLFIRKFLVEKFGRKPAEQVPIIYGGAVKPENAEVIMRDGGVEGLLIGSASLSVKQFTEILRAAVTN